MKTNIRKSVLDKFKLYYEEMEKKKVQKAVRISELKRPASKKVTLSTPTVQKPLPQHSRFAKFAELKSKFFTRKPKSKPSISLSKRAQLEQKRARRAELFRGIIGIGLLLVVVSIARSTFIALQFVDGAANIVYLIPQIGFAVIISIIAFLKIYK